MFICDGPDAGTVADEKCKIGMTGPGGGVIFLVDYNDQYEGFNYLEAAPVTCENRRTWSSATTSVPDASGWAKRAVGAGSSNTAAIKTVFNSDSASNNAAHFATSCSAGAKTDWFLGSGGEIKLMFDNLQGIGGIIADGMYWTSSQNDAFTAWGGVAGYGSQDQLNKSTTIYVRPIRSF